MSGPEWIGLVGGAVAVVMIWAFMVAMWQEQDEQAEATRNPKTCPHCDIKWNSSYDYCPYCGHRLKEDSR